MTVNIKHLLNWLKNISRVLFGLSQNKTANDKSNYPSVEPSESSSDGKDDKKTTSSPKKLNLTSQQSKGVDVTFTDGNYSLPITTLSDNFVSNTIPTIPIPMDSKLGKILYPVLGNKDEKLTMYNTSSTISTTNNGLQLASTKVDGTDYSALLIDQTKKLLHKNKLKPRDLIKLLKTSHVINDSQLPYDKKNRIGDSNKITKKPTARSTVNDNKGNTIHITLKRKNGYLLLEPDENEAYEKKLYLVCTQFLRNKKKVILLQIKRRTINRLRS